MAGIRQRGTAPEFAVRVALCSLGVAYRLNVKTLPGSPDLANKRRQIAVFVQGCYWHHHTNCNRATIPRRNESFWRAKFAANRKRDADAIRRLRNMHFRVALIWECQTADVKTMRRILSRALRLKMRKARRINVT
jgi:DNA mismatch endonuclease (patch repair protein)